MKKIFKRTLAIFMIALMVLSCAPVGSFLGIDMSRFDLSLNASAKTVPASGSCGENVTYTYNSETKELVISGTGAMEDYNSYNDSPFYDSDIESVVITNGVTTIGNYAFYSCDSLTSVTIGDSVTTIGDRAFDNCGLTSVTMPDSVITIGDEAFRWCESLTSVTIGSSVTTIGAYAFADCENLTNVTIPDNVTTIGAYAFYRCNGLTSVTIGSSVTTIGAWAFYWCDSLTSVTIPDSVTTIGTYAFAACESLTSVTIPDNETTIGAYAFEGCISLTSITIPDSVTTIGNYAFSFCISITSVTISGSVTTIGDCAFSDCYSLTSVTVDEDNQYYCNDEYGVLFDKNKIKLIQYPVGNTRAEYTIPDSVTTIGDYAFYNCTSLTSVIIPDSVTTIGDYAFWKCTGLTSVTIPGSVTAIGFWAFCWCESLTSITIPNSVTTICRGAFNGCGNLTSVIIPDSVTTIGHEAFVDCDSLTDVYYCGTEEQWNAITIGDCNEDLTNATIHYNFVCEHSFGEYTVTKQPTCTEPGEKTATCSICSAKDTETIPATGHKYNAVTTAPTCEEKGFTTYTCFCGDSYTTDYVDANGHSYSSFIETEPNCTEAGMKVYKCACGDAYNENIPKLGHDFSKDFTVDKQATYTETGSESKHCLRAGCTEKSEIREIPKLVAVFTDSDIVKSSDNNIVTVVGATIEQILAQADKGAVVKDSKGNVLGADALSGTGMTITMADGKQYDIVVFGDADGDGKVAASDARLALRASVGLENYNEDSPQHKAANVGSEDKLSASDARLILRASVGLEDPKSWI